MRTAWCLPVPQTALQELSEQETAMTDKELLEKAAKAAGIKGEWVRDPAYRWQERWYFNVPYDNQNMLTGFEWNPLTDDGDALRLAVKLGANVYSGYGTAVAEIPNDAEHDHISASEHYNNDPYAATRRAIVRAAAEIGKAL